MVMLCASAMGAECVADRIGRFIQQWTNQYGIYRAPEFHTSRLRYYNSMYSRERMLFASKQRFGCVRITYAPHSNCM